MKTATSLLLLVLTITIQAELRADEPLPPPATKEVWSPNKQFCAVMDPKAMTTTIFRVEDDGKKTKSWAMPGWFRVAHLADDGEHLIVGHGGINLLPLNVTKVEPVVEFFKRGKFVNTVTFGELLKDQSSLKRTVSHYLWGSYLGLDDDGKYGESWDAAANYLKNAVGKNSFVKSLKAARKPLGKLKSREVKSKEYRISLPGAPDGEYVVIQFKNVFENKTSAVETITPMLDKDKRWKVSG